MDSRLLTRDHGDQKEVEHFSSVERKELSISKKVWIKKNLDDLLLADILFKKG
jgi:hypothetical protein